MNRKGQVGLIVLSVFGVLILISVIGFIAQGADFFMFKFWAPKYANVQREVFQNTKSYNQGMAQDLDNYYVDYQRATPDQKDAIAAVVLHEVADYPNERLPAHLQAWVDQLRSSIK